MSLISQEFATGDFVRAKQLNQLQKNQNVLKDILKSSFVIEDRFSSFSGLVNTSYEELFSSTIYIPSTDFNLLCFGGIVRYSGGLDIKFTINSIDFIYNFTGSLATTISVYHEILNTDLSVSGFYKITIYAKVNSGVAQFNFSSCYLRIGDTLG